MFIAPIQRGCSLPVCDLIVPSILPINNVTKNSMAPYDEVKGASKRKEVRLDIGFEWIISMEVKSAGLATPTHRPEGLLQLLIGVSPGSPTV
jgi:hypothetical protein